MDYTSTFLNESFLKILLLLFSKETKIAILGPQGSGKTELWYALQGKSRTSDGTTSNELIERFLLGENSNGYPICVERTQDIGGGNEFVSLYDKLVMPDTFVYFILDITKIGSTEYKKQPLSQFHKILSVIEKNVRLKKEKLGHGFFSSYMEKNGGLKGVMDLRILATHIDEYRGDISQGVKFVRDYFAPLEAYGIDRTTLNVKLVNLKNANDIQEIRKEVLMSLN